MGDAMDMDNMNVDMEADIGMEADINMDMDMNMNMGIGVADDADADADELDPNADAMGADPNADADADTAIEETDNGQDPAIKQEEEEEEEGPTLPESLTSLHEVNTATTAVDGQGMWRAWTRVFEKPESACLDLLDNCLDATLHAGFHGKVVMKVMTSYQDATTTTATNNNVVQYPNGICIMNNSKNPIQNLQDALTVYKSDKNAAAYAVSAQTNTNTKDSIGENGVGLKHGCATLCDTSFVLTRNGTTVQVGVVAKALQASQGVFLPSFVLDLADASNDVATTAEVRRLLQNALETHPPSVSQVIAKDLGRGSLRQGTRQLAHQIMAMWDGGQEYWSQEEHVFQVLLCNLHHSITTNNGKDSGEAIDVDNPTPYVSPAKAFLRSIQELLPEYYINISESFDFFIDGERASFTYWQHRLVELTEFNVNIPLDKPIEQYPDHSDWSKQGYPLSIYCGFDAQRVLKDVEGGCRMFVYSRQAGRLITREEDARHILGLSTTGSMYMQGLTIIIDDRGSQLPLMPTKDGIAWSEQKGGDVHRHNLYAWVGGVVQGYWREHFNKFEGKEKGFKAFDLMKRTIKSFAAEQQERASASADKDQKHMASAQFTRFTFKWKKLVSKHDRKLSIRRLSRGSMIYDGPDTLFHITPERVQRILADVRSASQNRALKNPPRSTRKKAPPPVAASMPTDGNGADDEEPNAGNDGRRASRKRGVSYVDIDSSDDGEEPTIAYNPARKRAALKRGDTPQQNDDNAEPSPAVDEEKMLQIQLQLQQVEAQLTEERLKRVQAEKALKTEQELSRKQQTKAKKAAETKLRSELAKVKKERDSYKKKLEERVEEGKTLSNENKTLRESLENEENNDVVSNLQKQLSKLKDRVQRRNARIRELEERPARPPSPDGGPAAVTPRKLHYETGEIQSI